MPSTTLLVYHFDYCHFPDVDSIIDNNPGKFLDEAAASHVLDVSYADDTLLAGTCCQQLQHYLRLLIKTADAYGLQPNWDKTVHIRVGHSEDIMTTPAGNPTKPTNQAV